MNRPLRITPIRGGTISARPATSMSGSVPGVSVTRGKTSAWVFVNPYMTLVASYERLIRGRGEEIKEQDVKDDLPTASIPAKPLPAVAPVPPADAAAKPTETAVESPPPKEPGTRRDERVDESSPVKASLSVHVGGGRGNVERNGTRAGKQIVIRPVGRSLPRAGARTWHIRRHVHTGYGQYQTRYDSF